MQRKFSNKMCGIQCNIYKGYRFLFLESEILANSNLYFTGSGRPHDKLKLDWKILAVVKLCLLIYTQEAEQTFLVLYPSSLPSPLDSKVTYYENLWLFAQRLFSHYGSTLGPCTGQAEHARDTMLPDAALKQRQTWRQWMKSPAPLPMEWNNSEECIPCHFAVVTCLIMNPTWATFRPLPVFPGISFNSATCLQICVSTQESIQSHKRTWSK